MRTMFNEGRIPENEKFLSGMLMVDAMMDRHNVRYDATEAMFEDRLSIIEQGTRLSDEEQAILFILERLAKRKGHELCPSPDETLGQFLIRVKELI